MLKKYYLGGFFWVPILHKQYQNTSGFAAEYLVDCTLNSKLNVQLVNGKSARKSVEEPSVIQEQLVYTIMKVSQLIDNGLTLSSRQFCRILKTIIVSCGSLAS